MNFGKPNLCQTFYALIILTLLESLKHYTTGNLHLGGTVGACAVNWSVGLVCLCMRGIPHVLGCCAYLSVWQEVGALCVERLAVFVPSLPPPLLSTVYQCDGCLSYQGRGGSWLGCQVLPAISAVSILELAANSGSSRLFQAPNLHRLSECNEVV